jgi:hypothetical protein
LTEKSFATCYVYQRICLRRIIKMISRLSGFLALVFLLAGVQTIAAQYTNRVVAEESLAVEVLYNNGEYSTGTTSRSGVTAPAGYVWSESQSDTGNTTETNSVLGFGATVGSVTLADNFTIPAGQSWKISSLTVYGFFVNWTASQSPFTGGIVRIWNGRPGDAGATVIFGDTTTDRLLSSTRANAYSIANSTVPAPGIVPNTTRELWENKLSIAPTLTLGAGTYWVEFATSTFGGGAQFYRNVIVSNNRTQAGWNARQWLASSNAWGDVLDGGSPASAPDVPQDIAFRIRGTIASSNNASKFADYDGDGKTDFGVTRWGVAPTDPSTWYILRNNGTGTDYSTAVFGNRIGTVRGVFTPVQMLDVVMPEDYDGDGKTDIAVFDALRATTAQPANYFYILNSSNNTIRIEQFGTRLDVANMMGDYDGDGKADLVVWRQGATAGAQSTFWIKKSSNGEINAIAWGIQGDRPILGDFDGDGKKDFAVARVASATGQANAYILRSSDAQVEIKSLPYPFVYIVPGDYDGDGKTDIATIRNSVNDMLWMIQRSSDNVTESIRSGVYSTDAPVQGDYNGDGKTDIAVFRKTGLASTNPASFWIRQADGSYTVIPWGAGGDTAIASIRVF